MKKCAGWMVLLAVMTAGHVALAHHSFAVFFDDKRIVQITGVVTEFHFTNPHGVIALAVKNTKKQIEQWRVETNAPTLLRRRGWTKESLKVGDAVVVEGWHARDGSNYMRMRKVTRSDGTVLGAAIQGQVAETKEEQR